MAGTNNFHRIADALPGKARNLVDAYQGFGLDLAVQLAPVDDGDLRGSGAMAPGDGEFDAKVVFTAEHAAPQEFGTVDMAPQPYLRPAFDDLRPHFKRDTKGLLKP